MSRFQIGDTDRCAIPKVADRSSYGAVPVLLEGCLLLAAVKSLIHPILAFMTLSLSL